MQILGAWRRGQKWQLRLASGHPAQADAGNAASPFARGVVGALYVDSSKPSACGFSGPSWHEGSRVTTDKGSKQNSAVIITQELSFTLVLFSAPGVTLSVTQNKAALPFHMELSFECFSLAGL